MTRTRFRLIMTSIDSNTHSYTPIRLFKYLQSETSVRLSPRLVLNQVPSSTRIPRVSILPLDHTPDHLSRRKIEFSLKIRYKSSFSIYPLTSIVLWFTVVWNSELLFITLERLQMPSRKNDTSRPTPSLSTFVYHFFRPWLCQFHSYQFPDRYHWLFLYRYFVIGITIYFVSFVCISFY